MLNLQPLIDRLVDDVLHALRGATLDELRAHGLTPRRAPATKARPRAAPAAARAPRQPRVAPPSRVAPARKKAPVVRSSPTLERAARPVVRLELLAPLSPANEEITDPEELLAMSWEPAPARGARAPLESTSTGYTSLDEPPPPSSVRPTASSPVALRDGETLARASGAGVVIRRAKK